MTETSEEYERKNQLEEEFRSVMDKYKYKRRQIREMQEDLQVGSFIQLSLIQIFYHYRQNLKTITFMCRQ